MISILPAQQEFKRFLKEECFLDVPDDCVFEYIKVDHYSIGSTYNVLTTQGIVKIVTTGIHNKPFKVVRITTTSNLTNSSTQVKTLTLLTTQGTWDMDLMSMSLNYYYSQTIKYDVDRLRNLMQRVPYLASRVFNNPTRSISVGRISRTIKGSKLSELLTDEVLCNDESVSYIRHLNRRNSIRPSEFILAVAYDNLNNYLNVELDTFTDSISSIITHVDSDSLMYKHKYRLYDPEGMSVFVRISIGSELTDLSLYKGHYVISDTGSKYYIN